LVDGYVTDIHDVLYIANSATMEQLSETTYVQDEKARKVVVRTTIKVPQSVRAAAEDDKKKGRTVVRTTVKNTDWDADMSRGLFGDWDNVEEMILAKVEMNKKALAEGEILKIEVIMEFEGVDYELFVNSIDVPPYSPFIQHVAE